MIGNRWQVLFHFEQDGFTDNVNDIVPLTLLDYQEETPIERI